MMNFFGLLFIFFFVLCMNLQPSSAIARTNYNVLSFGAKGNGRTDSTQAFIKAWAAACGSTESITIYVPRGRYLLGSMAFKGDCKSPDITIRIDGTLVAPTDYRVLGQANNWLSFEGVSGVSIIGGALDAKGSALWVCKAAGSNCPNGATTLSITNSNNIRINRLLSLNSQMFHIVINGCQDVHIEGVKVIAAGDSPNTDGIHVQLSRNVMIRGSSIKTGDDCISIGPGTKNLWIERINCGPGHGISIGSLGKDMGEEGVQNVTVKTTVFTGTQNGLRIKSWARPSNGFVQGVRFIGAVMKNVQNPIVIDQNYCPRNLNCPGQVSGVKISEVMYQEIRGTSTTPIAIKFDCSTKYPCKGIRLQNVNLTYLNRVAQSSCSNVIGKSLGLVKPNTCL
ncbi:polygalacturonase-like [Melia azedarach]|uniref:Polygalacturonase-like n=1 Tax=Melia azedarach TaxID=155640 RepID=A0ACC1YFN5_MELAZ|nr:polygalacturonase-like [Melia azedarach]